MQKESETINNKFIDWSYLPDEQLAGVVVKYPFYTRANVEVVKRIWKDGSQNLNNLGDKTSLYISNHSIFRHFNHSDNKFLDNISNYLETNNSSITSQRKIDVEEVVLLDKSPADPAQTFEPLVPIEPLHTVDYFLSQGIKITDDAVSNDKLGTQLKSFTDWLKSMKKVHTQKMEMLSENTDKIIQTIAEHSNEAAGVETEAMAEVLIRQGKRLQALNIYQKLSLKNPSESAYFAAKIQSLKQA